MWTLQHILVYVFVILAVGYLVRKYLLTGTRKKKKSGNTTDCGPDCGCH